MNNHFRRIINIIYLVFFLSFLLFDTSAQAGIDIPLTVNVSENVVVIGSPRIAVNVGGVIRYATYSSGSGTSTLIFTYTMTAGDIDLDGITLISPVDVNGGTIKDMNGNDAQVTFSLPNTSGIKVNYPSLGMDFTADSDGRYTLNSNVYNDLSSFLTATGGSFTRASIGTFYNSSGVLQTSASGVPRFDHDPVTLQAKGLLIEEGRTNLLLQSNSFLTAPWDVTTCGGVTNSGGTTTAPDGNTVPIYDFSTTSCIFQDVAATIGNVITHTIWIKANKTGTLGFRTPGAGGSLTSTSISVNTTWKQFTLTATAIAATSRFLIDNRASNGYGVSGLQLSLWAGQMEVGPYASSYIPTTTVAVTRQADILSMPTGAWFNPSQGTTLAEADYTGSSNIGGVFALNDNGTNNRVDLRAGQNQAIISSGGLNTSLAPISFAGGTTKKVSIAYSSTIASASLNGGAVVTGTPMVPVGINKLWIGNIDSGSYPLAGHIAKFKYYPAATTSAQLQLLTQ
jgi:hypothetical protein